MVWTLMLLDESAAPPLTEWPFGLRPILDEASDPLRHIGPGKHELRSPRCRGVKSAKAPATTASWGLGMP